MSTPTGDDTPSGPEPRLSPDDFETGPIDLSGLETAPVDLPPAALPPAVPSAAVVPPPVATPEVPAAPQAPAVAAADPFATQAMEPVRWYEPEADDEWVAPGADTWSPDSGVENDQWFVESGIEPAPVVPERSGPEAVAPIVGVGAAVAAGGLGDVEPPVPHVEVGEPAHAEHIPEPGFSNESVLPAHDGGGRRRGGGGGGATPSPLGRILLPIALAIVSAVALVAAWAHLQNDQGSVASPGTTASSTKPPVPTLSSSPSTSGTPSTSPSGSASTSATPSDTASPSGSTSPSSSLAVDRSVPVVVLNATRRTGLGSKVARQLRADGWTVTSVGNWRRTLVSNTTVFSEGQPAAAATMVGDLPTGGSIEVPLSGMPSGKLVVVVGADYPRN